MAQILDRNNIPLLEGATNKEGASSLENKERCNALVVGYPCSSSLIIDSGASRIMASMHDSFSTLHPYSGTSILMGDDSEIPTKGIGCTDLDNGYFNNVLYLPSIVETLLSIYQMTHSLIQETNIYPKCCIYLKNIYRPSCSCGFF